MGGVIKQNSAILTTSIPNHIPAIGPDIPNALSAAETYSPPFNAITAGYVIGNVNNNIPIASMNIPKIA